MIADKWFSVKDKLPKDGQTIIAVFQLKGYRNGNLILQDNDISVGKYTKDCDWFKESKFGISNEYVINKPIYWMPVPDYKQLQEEDNNEV